jgi:UDP-2-acetamido-2-deoxy-ribo-hexuluronate aminotransferase
MNQIQMVDLKSQYHKIKEEVLKSIEKVIESSAFIQGSEVKLLEKNLAEFSGAGHCISCANGTDALQIAMMALELKEGDEIIVPTFTYIATAEAAALLNIKLVLCDVDPDTFNLDVQKIESLITKKTKAIVPVHLFGQCADMKELMTIARKYNLSIIEDAAQSIGAEYSFDTAISKVAGTIGHIGTTSFFPSKNLGCYGDGGAILTNDEALAAKIRMVANHGQGKKYYHDSIGINSRLDTMQAAILNVKIKHLKEYIKARQKAAGFYDEHLGNLDGIRIPVRNQRSTHVFHQYSLLINGKDRNDFKTYLEKEGIPSMIYYPLPVHFQKAYSYLGYKEGDFPVSEDLCKKIIALPMHTELEEDQLIYITEKIINYFK